jgi:hypothetical protein
MYALLPGAVVALWVVFAVSAAGKSTGVRRQGAFAESLRPLALIPERLLAPTALAVTGAEIVVVAGLTWAFLGIATGSAGTRSVAIAALVLAAALLAVLTGGIAVALNRGTTASCACFGAAERPLSRRHLVRNGVLFLIAVAGAGVAGQVPVAAVDPPAVLLAGATGAVGALVLIRFDDLVDLFTPASPAGRSRRARS